MVLSLNPSANFCAFNPPAVEPAENTPRQPLFKQNRPEALDLSQTAPVTYSLLPDRFSVLSGPSRPSEQPSAPTQGPTPPQNSSEDTDTSNSLASSQSSSAPPSLPPHSDPHAAASSIHQPAAPCPSSLREPYGTPYGPFFKSATSPSVALGDLAERTAHLSEYAVMYTVALSHLGADLDTLAQQAKTCQDALPPTAKTETSALLSHLAESSAHLSRTILPQLQTIGQFLQGQVVSIRGHALTLARSSSAQPLAHRSQNTT